MYYVPAWTHTHPHTHTSHSYLGNLGLFPSRMEYHADACEREGWLLTCGVGSLGWVLALEGRLCLIKHYVFGTAFDFTAFQRAVQNAPQPLSTEEPQPSPCVSLTQLAWLEGGCWVPAGPSSLTEGGDVGGVFCLIPSSRIAVHCPTRTLLGDPGTSIEMPLQVGRYAA